MSIATLLDKAADWIFAPFASWERLLTALGGVPAALSDSGSKTAWPYLLTSLVVACVLYRRAATREPGRARSLLSFLWPTDVYRRPSAIVDYQYVAIDLTIRSVVYTPFMAGLAWVIHKSVLPVTTRLLAVDVPLTSPTVRAIVLTLLAVVLADFGFFLTHWLMHRVPALWHFHEVHHSAEVLTPVTVYRVHPVEDLMMAWIGAVFTAVATSVFAALRGSEADIITLFGTNIVWVAFFSCAFQLRHSHLWLSYGPLMSRIFISPAQHHIHHSVDARHWDKNFGYLFAVWDTLFGTVYVPRTRETLTFGVPADPRDFSSVSKLYLLPFVKAARTLRSRRPRREPVVTTVSASG